MTGEYNATLFDISGPEEQSTEAIYRRVSSRADVDSFSDVNAEANELPLEWLRRLYTTTYFIDHVYSYVGSVDGKDIATAAVVQSGTWLFVINVATLAAYRHRGYGTGVTRHAIREAVADTGLEKLILFASSDGAPIYETLGFAKSGDIRLMSLEG
jgi:ribosomal protein S18 acetylase RimI-like enzyme